MAKITCKPQLLSCPQSSLTATDMVCGELAGCCHSCCKGGWQGEGDPPQHMGVGEVSELGCKVKGGLCPGGLVGTESRGNSPFFFQL